MKELSIVKQMVADGQISQEVAEKYFPELKLKESEDESVRKEILDYCKNRAEKYPNDPKYRNISAWISWLERQCEKKPASKVEPKFKVGDWVVWDNKISCHVDNIYQGKESLMYTITDVNNMTRSYSVKGFDNNAHLWTIQDAKDGNVIYEKSTETIILFKSENCGWIDSHCSYWQKTKTFERGERQYGRVSEMDICPATEEQRELLFSKMREAGNKWNSEKKELTKIEHNPAWGEEDEDKIVKLKSFIAQCNGFNKENRNKAFDLIDSIRNRYTWRPSKEQMEAMQVFLEHGCAAPDKEASSAEKVLELLYNDLKNL